MFIISFRIIFDFIEYLDPHNSNISPDEVLQFLVFFFGSAVFVSVHKTDRIEYKVNMNLIGIFVYCINTLIDPTNFLSNH